MVDATPSSRREVVTAAIYARFSTDRQRETSVDDQVRVCRVKADELGAEVVGVYSDSQTSGATIVANRTGGGRMLGDAMAGRFDVLLLEGLDRLARDQVEQETIVRRLEHRGVRIVGASDGYDSQSGDGRKLLRGVRGMINESYVDDIRKKTHRGLDGQVLAGFHGGGLSYGYRSVPVGRDARGEPIGHRLEVDAGQAEHVREVFARYAAGESCRAIVYDLNRRGIVSPRGNAWAASGLYGSPAKGSGVLNNELYVGRYVWNRSQWVKDPDTRRRQRFDRPRSEWRVIERPDLRIVTDAAWASVRDRIGAPRALGGGQGAGPRPSTLFGGLLRCGHCGGPMTAVNAILYGCSRNKERGPAACVGTTVGRRVADVRLLAQLRDELLRPARVAEAERKIAAAMRDQRDGSAARAARLRDVERQVDRLADAVATVGLSDALRARLAKAEGERADLVAVLRGGHSTAAADPLRAYRAMLVDLRSALASEPATARPILLRYFEALRVVNAPDGTFVECYRRAARIAVGAGVDNQGCGDRLFLRLRLAG